MGLVYFSAFAKQKRTRQRLITISLFAIIALSVAYVAGHFMIPRSFMPLAGHAAASPVAHLRMCAEGERNTSTKTCVVDGDTLWINGTKYRLESFDTPEPMTDICGGDAEVALAHQASARLLALLNGNVWTMTTGGLDLTGTRTLATIRINGRDVGDILISEHLARHWPDGEEFWCKS